MNQPVNPTPSLLTLTAPSPEPVRSEDASSAFAEELSAASPSQDSREETEEGVPHAETAEVDSANGSDPQASSENRVQEQPEEDNEEIADESVDAGLLAVTLVSETIISETSPHATLPDHAATTVDVGLEVEEVATHPTLPDTGIAGETPAVDASLDAEGQEARLTESPTEGIDSDAQAEAAAQLVAGDQDAASSHEQPSEGLLITETKPTDSTTKASAIESPTTATAQTNEAIQPTEQASRSSLEDGGEESTGEGRQPNPPTPASQDAASEAAATDATNSENASPRETSPVQSTASVEALKERAEAVRSEAADSRPTVDPARFISRVSRAIETAHERGGGPIEIRLSPPELGSLRVQIEMKEGVLSASLEAETPAARNTLLDNLPALRERLEQQQIRLEKFDVDVRDDSQQRGGGGGPEGDTQRRPDDSSERREPASERGAERESTSTEPQRPVATITFDDDGLNLVA